MESIDIPSIVLGGLAYGMLLFIVSVGLSVTMGLMGFVNLAHGAFAMIGGYVVVTLMGGLGANFFLALLAAFVLVALVSVVFERLLYAPLYRADELSQVLLTIGLVFMMIATVTFFWGTEPKTIRLPSYLAGPMDLGFTSFPAYRIFMIGVGAAMIVALWLGFERTTIGAQIRAAVDNRRMAQSLGINVDRLFTMTFALGSGLAAMGGGLGIEIIGLNPQYALNYLVFFLIVVAVGGLGSIRGTFLAALVIGMFDFAGKRLYPEAGAFFIYAITIAVLLWRPQGLFGRR
ncbi:MAG: branched-chain amino acid ABC transporter permease [Alphaproteobacteria bacterium]|nr:branched-chain amino acid ABC transporter permease [Alphaproteobacteria bacterium]